LRWDGVTTRARALQLLVNRVRDASPSEWIAVLGGWSEEQFTDEARGFSLDELDRIAPNNPVVLQSVYNHSYLNSAALRTANIDDRTQDPPGGKIEKDSAGKITGLIQGAGGVAFVAAKIPLKDEETWFANTRRYVAYLNSLGITAWSDAGGRGMSAKHYEPYRRLAESGELNARVFWLAIRQPFTPEQVDRTLVEVPQQKPFQGTDYFDQIGWGETIYGPATTNTMRADAPMRPEDMAQVRRIVDALAAQGLHVNAHVEMQSAIDAYLDQYETVTKAHPIKGLRWVFSHVDQVTDAQLERMKRLGMSAQLHSRPLIQGVLMPAARSRDRRNAAGRAAPRGGPDRRARLSVSAGTRATVTAGGADPGLQQDFRAELFDDFDAGIETRARGAIAEHEMFRPHAHDHAAAVIGPRAPGFGGFTVSRRPAARPPCRPARGAR
jgi:predicted amidohydrolase YtcJ